MNILLINPPYQTLTSTIGVGHQVPLGLLCVGGPLIDAGHQVRLLDAESRNIPIHQVANAVRRLRPDIVMTGHAGSTPAHPICIEMLRAIKLRSPLVFTVYGGVFPTYHARQILASEMAVNCIVRGEGEATASELIRTLSRGGTESLEQVPGISFRTAGGKIMHNAPRAPIRQLDDFRVGWELIRCWDDYQCFGLGRAAIVQFSRGCPHRCTYCGQHQFWARWRHRTPSRVVDEIEWLHRTHHVRFITLADENPTTIRSTWREFLDELARRQLPVHLFATIRATDIVRDAELLPLYRRAGILYVLMGIESTSDEVLSQIHKGSTTRHDLQACRLLRRNGIFSIVGHIVGFADETAKSFAVARRHLTHYDGDYLNAMYVTPHDWTEFGSSVEDRSIVQRDQKRWDYRHQVLAQRQLRPWQLLLLVKWLELAVHLHPRRLWRMLATSDRFVRRQYLWCSIHTATVWAGEILDFVMCSSRTIRRGRVNARSRVGLPVVSTGDAVRQRCSAA